MIKLFTDKESTAISFLALTFLIGVGVDRYRDFTAESRLAESIPMLIAEDKIFKDAAELLQSEFDISSSVTKLNDDGTLHSLEINEASLTGLMMLPGVGETIAGRIISMRDSIIAFQSADDLLKIKGIGKKN